MAAKHESDTLNAGYCEYMTKVKASSRVIMARIALLIATSALLTAMLVVTLKTIPVVSFMLGALIVFMAWFVFQFTKIEYEYTIATGTFTLSKIYGARMRKDVLEFKTSDMVKIVPFSSLDSLNAQNVFYTCKKTDMNIICILYSVKDSENSVLVISAPDKTISCLKFYRRSAFSDF